MNIPNALSLFRIILVPLFLARWFAGDVRSTLTLMALSALSDVLDGAIARRFDMETRLGRALDPAADKLFEGAMMLCAASAESSVWLLLGLHVLCESVLSLMALLVLRRTGQVLRARWFGKLCTGAVYVLMLAIMALPGFRGPAALPWVWLCSALVLLCAGLYLAEFLRLLRSGKAGL